MKKLLILFLLTTTILFSQSERKNGIGFRGGANISKLTNASLDYKTNVYLSVFYQIRYSKLYALQPEIGYSNQGGKIKTNDGGNIYLEYISIGVANKFFVTQNSGFHLLLTPSIDLDIDDTFIGILNRGGGEGNDATFIDFSISLGFGFEFKNGLGIEARYKHGLVDVYSGSFHDFISDQLEYESQFHSIFQIGLTYKFNLTKKEE